MTITVVAALTVAVLALLIALAAYGRTMIPQAPSCRDSHAAVTIDTQIPKSESPLTIVLFRCTRCECRWTHILNGHWELGSLIKERNDLNELERIAGREGVRAQ
jgi:hypothetical protein